jgi:rod shape-determining protein MreC
MRLFNFNFLKRSSVATFTAGLVFSAVLFVLPAGLKQWIGKSVVATVFAPLEWPLYQARSLLFSWRENRFLKDELAMLRLEKSFYQEAARENLSLQQALQLKKASSFTMLAARVSSREPGWLAPELLIDKGNADSVTAGMVAVSTMGLVGIVRETGQNSSNLQTIFSPESRVSAIDLRSRVLGIFKAQSGMNCVMDRVALRSDVKTGDTLVTSGYGGVFPYGLMLGVVQETRADKKKLVLDITVGPSLNLDRLDQVLLITGGQVPALPQLVPATDVSDSMAGKPRQKRTMQRPEIRIRAPDIRISVPDTIPLLPENNP